MTVDNPHDHGPATTTGRPTSISISDIDFVHRRITLQVGCADSKDARSRLADYLGHCLRCGFSRIVLYHAPGRDLPRGMIDRLENKYQAEIETIPVSEISSENSGGYRAVRYACRRGEGSPTDGSVEHRIRFEDFGDAINQISEFVLIVGHAELLDPMTISRTRLGLTELISNSIEHATFEDVDPAIDVTLSILKNHIELKYSDNALAFNSSKPPAVDIDALISRRVKRGLGLHLLRQMADGLEYQRANNWNITTFKLERRNATGDTEEQ